MSEKEKHKAKKHKSKKQDKINRMKSDDTTSSELEKLRIERSIDTRNSSHRQKYRIQ